MNTKKFLRNAAKTFIVFAAMGTAAEPFVVAAYHFYYETDYKTRLWVWNNHDCTSTLERDALRHSYASFQMTEMLGPDMAMLMGEMSESVSDMLGNNGPKNRGMDLYNNAKGREYARDTSLQQLQDDKLMAFLWNQTQNGELVTTRNDPRSCAMSYRHADKNYGEVFEWIKDRTASSRRDTSLKVSEARI